MNSEELVLEGTLLRVLQMSRLLGGAPLHFERSGQCTTASVSHSWYIYSCVTATVLNTLTYLLNYLLQPLFPQDDVNKSQLFVALRICQDVLLSMRVFLSSFTSYKRIKSLALQLNGLDMVFREFNKKSTAADRQNKVLFFVMALILLSNVIRIVCFVQNEINIYSTVASIGVDIIVFCQLVMSVLQEFTVVLVHVKVAEALNVLKMHLRRIRHDQCLSVQQEIVRVGRSYLKLYEVVSQTNRHEGGVIFLAFASIVASLVYSGFVFADDLNNLEKSHLSFDTLMIVVPSVASIHRIIIITRSCYQIDKEVCEINMSVSDLVYSSAAGAAGRGVSLQVDALIQQLQLARPAVSVLGVFTVKQSTLTTILSAWVTYTVILIQVRSKQSSR